MKKLPFVHPDIKHPRMWRVLWHDDLVSDMVNLTRAKDAIAMFLRSDECRLLNGRRPRRGAPPIR